MDDAKVKSEPLEINKKVEQIISRVYPLPEDGLRSDMEQTTTARKLLREDLHSLIKMVNDLDEDARGASELMRMVRHSLPDPYDYVHDPLPENQTMVNVNWVVRILKEYTEEILGSDA